MANWRSTLRTMLAMLFNVIGHVSHVALPFVQH